MTCLIVATMPHNPQSNTTGYKHTGASFPLSSLGLNKSQKNLAAKLHEQAIQMADAQQNGKHFTYKPIKIPLKQQSIFLSNIGK